MYCNLGIEETHAVPRTIFWTFLSLSISTCVLALLSNRGRKYIRIKRPDQCDVEWADIFENTDGIVSCCIEVDDSTLSLPYLCIASTSSTVYRWMTTLPGAVLIPLAGLCSRCASDIVGSFSDSRRYDFTWIFRRFLLYAIIILFRMFVLYMTLAKVQNLYNWMFNATTDECWYAQYYYKRKCRNDFDFSDHIVLYMCQYISIQMVEFYAARKVPQNLSIRIVQFIISGVLVASLLGQFNTVAYFHTRAESAVGALVSIAFLFLPIGLLFEGRYRTYSRWLSIDFYVYSGRKFQYSR